MKKRLLAGLLSLLMLVGVLPVTAFAAGGNSALVTHTAENLDKDYCSKVTMTFPSSTVSGEMDIVFVLDGSTSKDQSGLANKAAEMLTDLAGMQGLEVNAGLVIFGGVTPVLYKTDGLISTSDKTALENMKATMVDDRFDGDPNRSGSNLQGGIEAARELLKSGTATAENKYMVLLTDGGARMWINDEGKAVAQLSSYLNWNTVEDFRARYIDGTLELRTFDTIMEEAAAGAQIGKYAITKEESEDTRNIVTNLDPSITISTSLEYYSNLEAATYFAAQSLMETKEKGEANIIWVDYPYYTGSKFEEYTDSFKSWLADEGYIARYDSSVPSSDPFDQVKGSLLALLGSGSTVKNVIGYGTDNYGNDYDFELVHLDQLVLTVGGQTYSAAKITDSRYGFGTPVNGVYPFQLDYYPNGEDGSSDECFLLTINQALQAGENVSLEYQVQLTDPQAIAGEYGRYDEDGSKGYKSLLVSKEAALTPKDSQGTIGSAVPFPLPTVSYTVTDDSQKVQVNLTPLTVYVGGDGYEGVVTDNQGNVAGVGENTLPEPGYTIDLPAALDEVLKQAVGVDSDETLDLSDYLEFTYNDGVESRVWHLELYDQNEENTSMVEGRYLYRLVPGEGQVAIRLQFRDEAGNLTTSDDFDIGQTKPNQTYTMSIYPGALNQGLVQAEITLPGGQDNYTFSLQLKPAELKIRGVVSEEENPTTDIVNQTPQQAVTEMTAQLPQDTKFFYKNSSDENSEIQVADGSAVALLVDEVLPSAIGTLEQKAVDTLGGTLPAKYNVEMLYLDLVYTKNSNAVVGASNPVTLYWPYPEGTDQNTQFFVVHYKGLNRNDDVALTDHYTLELYTAQNQGEFQLENTEQGIRFTVDSFSPFALFWAKTDSGNTSGSQEKDDQGNAVSVTAAVQPAALPQTGDAALTGLWLLLGTAAVGGLFLTGKMRQDCRKGSRE